MSPGTWTGVAGSAPDGGLTKVASSRRLLLVGALGLSVLADGCSEDGADLHAVLAPARGQVEGATGKGVDVDFVLASARNRPVTLSFGHVGCGGRVPKIRRILAAVNGTRQERAFHIILDAIDGSGRYADLVRDVIGEPEDAPGIGAPLILFIRDDLWVRQSNRTVRTMLGVMHVPFGENGFVQSLNQIALFGRGDVFKGIRY